MEWIDINKGKPKYNKTVLVYCVPRYRYIDGIAGFEISTAYLEVDDIWYLDSKNLDEITLISHWMELPIPPKYGN